MRDLYSTNFPEGNLIIGDASHLLEIRRKAEHLNQMNLSELSVLYMNNEPNNLDVMARKNPERICLILDS